MTEADFDAAVADLAQHVEAPSGERLPAIVMSRLRTGDSRRRRGWRLRAAVAAALVFAVGVGVSPAVADWLGVPGLRITVFDDDPPSQIGQGLRLGRPVSLEDASRGVSFDLQVPSALGPPEEVWLRPSSEEVTFLWDRDGVATRVLLTQAPATGPVIEKQVYTGTTIDSVNIDGMTGYWIEGEPHVLRSAGIARLAGRVLVWSDGIVTFRFEAGIDRVDAVRIAGTLKPLQL